MEYLIKKAVQIFCERSGIFPAKNNQPEEWRNFVCGASRDKVEKVYRLWFKCANLNEAASQRVELILRERLMVFERPKLSEAFIAEHKEKIFWVHSDWNGQNILDYMRQYGVGTQILSGNKNGAHPFYIVDLSNRLRGIAISEGLVLAGVLNFAVSIDEADRIYANSCLKPLTSEDMGLLEKNRAKVRKMMKQVGMSSISGHYLLVDAQNSAWRGQWYDRKIVRLVKGFSGDYFLMAKL